MAARTRRIGHDARTRAKIRAAMLINRLTACVMGELVMSPGQVRATTALLNKVLPDLKKQKCGDGSRT